MRYKTKNVPWVIGNWIIATYTFSFFSVMLFLIKIHSSDVKQKSTDRQHASHIALVIKVKVKPETYVTHEQMISFETSDRSCQWKNSHVNHETESAVLWKSWIWRLFCSYVDVLHSSFNNNVKISFFFKFTFLSHRFHNEGNHQFIYRIPTRFLTMGLLFTRLWSLFTNEGMWWILRHCVFSWYNFHCK